MIWIFMNAGIYSWVLQTGMKCLSTRSLLGPQGLCCSELVAQICFLNPLKKSKVCFTSSATPSKTTFCLEGPQISRICPYGKSSKKMKMSMEGWWSGIDRGN